jgi:hypothetical protein
MMFLRWGYLRASFLNFLDVALALDMKEGGMGKFCTVCEIFLGERASVGVYM